MITGSLQANYQSTTPSTGQAKMLGLKRATTVASPAPKVDMGKIKEGKNEEITEYESS